MLRQPIEALVPECLIAGEPVGSCLERRRLQPTGPELRRAAPADETRALEHTQMLRHCRQAHVEGLGELRHGRLACREAGEDRAPGRIGESRECGVELAGVHIFNQLVTYLHG
jgi:hypothetical protein